MTDGSQPTAAEPGEQQRTAPGAGEAPGGAAPVPGDPVQRELTAVAEALAAARAGVPAAAEPPAVPDDDEVARLEQAHEVLRTTLDRADRGG